MGVVGGSIEEVGELFEGARFIHPWRPYQASVLTSLSSHLDDRRLHLVAPPGSGKTVLGLEVVRRLAGPTLVLVPSLTIREQWIDSFLDTYFPAGQEPRHLVSTDLYRPAVLTVATYQALNEASGDEELVSLLTRNNIATLVVDEAHHLRRAWWQALVWLIERCDLTTLVALTATPPYDVPAREWNRYLQLCGPIDEEIAAPTLVREGTLCPHQDYVYLCSPNEEEHRRLAHRNQLVESLISDLALDEELARVLADWPSVLDPEANRELIQRRLSFFLAVTIFLSSLRWEACAQLIRFFRLTKIKLPPLDRDWSEILLTGLLHQPPTHLTESIERRLRKAVREVGATQGARIVLRTSKKQRRSLRNNPGKLYSICRIVELEAGQLGADLRLVVLADRIGGSALEGAASAVPSFSVGAIFQALRRLRIANVSLGVLTGSLVLIPSSCRCELRALVGQIQDQPLAIDPAYAILRPTLAQRSILVAAVTELFTRGHIRTLVGTAALLGEGWDAPAINALILATTSAAQMTSNQLRGRALRRDPTAPNKVANIWHLACIDPLADANEDLDLLRRRFRSLLGLTLAGTEISSGLARLGDPGSEIDSWNTTMVRHASQRESVRRRWLESVSGESTSGKTLVREVRISSRMLTTSSRIAFHDRGWWVMAALRRWWTRRRLRAIAAALCEALSKLGFLGAEDPAKMKPQVTLHRSPHAEATWAIVLPGSHPTSQWRFVTAFSQVFDLLDNPRYLIHRGGRYWAVPQDLGRTVERARHLSRSWRRFVGRHELIYTGTPGGRSHLAVAKQAAILSYFEFNAEIHTRWG